MKNILIVFIVTGALYGCDVPIDLDLTQTEEKVIIEGVVTNNPALQYVKISKSLGFYESGISPRITDAVVTVYDDAGNEFTYSHYNGDHPDSAGYYFPTTPFVGEVGRTYELHVTANGKEYVANDKLYGVLNIDSLTYELNQEEFDDPEDPGRYYTLKMYAKEPQQTNDYYLFKFYRNNELAFDTETDVYFTDDKILGENIEGVEAPVFYASEDVAKVRIYSLSRNAFLFYNDLFNLLNNDGGMFGSPPSNCRNNLSNGALGFFQASAVHEAEILIE